MRTKRTSKRALHLLEILLVIGLLALAGGAIFWKLDRFIQYKQFQSDMAKLKSVLLHAKTLALNTRSDFRVILTLSKKGWDIQVESREEPTTTFRWRSTLSRSRLFLDNIPQQECIFDFFSSGYVSPIGTLKFQTKDQIVFISLSELFRQTSSHIHPG